jgi:ribosomal protein S20
MPRTTSAKKALRQNITRRARNVKNVKAYKMVLKTFRKTVASGNTSEASTMLPKLQKALFKVSKTRAISVNKARRLTARAAHAIAKASKASS